jgi:arylsulfatase A-like enzyme
MQPTLMTITRCLLSAFALFVLRFEVVSAEDVQRPNIVFILADDLGWTDLACYGSDLHETPHLDRLSRQGVRFTQATAMSVCSPTRAAILTGKHAARLGMTIWREGTFRTSIPRPNRPLLEADAIHDLPHSEQTIAELLKPAGYRTFHVGKWHLGDADHYPESQGFDVNVGGTHWGAPESYFWPFRGEQNFREFRYVPGLGLGSEGQYLTDRLTDEALRLIDEAGIKKKPFLLNLWLHAPHTPIEGKPELVDHYRSKIRDGMRHQNAEYAAMIHSVDQNVGRILQRLDDRGLAEKTLVIFTSDNGGYVNEYRGKRVTNNAPLRSGKGSLYEGGIRVPLIVRWPGTAPAGAKCDAPVTCMDYLPTIASAAGLEIAEKLDGVSLAPLLRDPRVRPARNELFFHYPHYYATTSPVSAIRSGDWKLLEYHEDNRLELFDLSQDPGEEQNLAEKEDAKANSLRNRLHAWRESVGAKMPTPKKET